MYFSVLNGKVFGDYKKYKTIYKKEEDGSVILSNDGSVWKEPVYTVTFEGLNCTMVGKTTQNVKTYDELEIPVKAKLDGIYVKKMSFLFDCKCFFMTVIRVIKRDGVVEGEILEKNKRKSQKENIDNRCE